MIFKRTFLSLFICMFAALSASAETSYAGDNGELTVFKSFMEMAGTQLMDNAKKYIGRPYRRGSAGPKAFDCSGFTSYVFKTLDIKLNRTSRAQFTQGKSVKRSDLRVGDLVFFKSASSGNGVGHVGIVSSVDDNGNFRFIHASCHHGVTISNINEGYWAKRYKGARRVIF